MHTTMQALGRFAVIGGSLLVALLNVVLFSDVDSFSLDAKRAVYASIYLYALAIPCVSIAESTIIVVSSGETVKNPIRV